MKATALVFSVLGFLYNLTFLGIIVEWIRSSMDHWSRTKSRVWHGGHVLVLGWSEKTLYLLNELFEKLLNSDKTPHVVLLADRDEAEMRQEVKQHFYQLWEGLSFFDRPPKRPFEVCFFEALEDVEGAEAAGRLGT